MLVDRAGEGGLGMRFSLVLGAGVSFAIGIWDGMELLVAALGCESAASFAANASRIAALGSELVRGPATRFLLLGGGGVVLLTIVAVAGSSFISSTGISGVSSTPMRDASSTRIRGVSCNEIPPGGTIPKRLGSETWPPLKSRLRFRGYLSTMLSLLLPDVESMVEFLRILVRAPLRNKELSALGTSTLDSSCGEELRSKTLI